MTGPGISSLLWFAVVVAAIPAVLWLLKRTPVGSGGAGGAMRVVGALALAPNQRVVAVEVGAGAERRWLVLGVTPQAITTLHSMPPQEAALAAAAGAQPPFAQALAKLWSKDGSGDAR